MIDKTFHYINELLKKDRNVLIFFFILSLLTFFPTYTNLNFFWDDERFIFLNPEFLQAESWYSFWIPNSPFYKTWPIGYSFFWIIVNYTPFSHFIFYKSLNLFFHAINSFVLYKIVKKIKLPSPILISSVFLIHPLHVENVSWIFQILTILSLTFFLLSLLNYFTFIEERNNVHLVLTFIFFIMSLLTKSIALLAPFFFLLGFIIYRVRFKASFLLIPFFLISLYLGLSNLKGTDTLAKKNANQGLGNAIVNIVNDGIASLTPGSIKKKITKDENYTYFDFIYYQKKKFDNYVFNRTEVFSQGIVYYTKQMLVPIDLQFIHKREVPNLFLAIVVFAVFFLGPVVFYYFKKDKLLLLIPGYIFSFLMPYLGVSFITFFYWSNVSDRYTYYFLVIYAVILGLIVRYFPKYSFRIILIYAFIMQFQAINYGFKFNTPHRLYEEIITYKPHPAIYSLLFEQYYIKLDLQNCEKVLKEGLEKFPENISLQQDAMKIENLRNYYRQVKNVD